MSALRKMGIEIPHDIAITGFDDIELASVTEPPLTTVRQPLQAMGEKAVTLLLNLMSPDSPTPTAPILDSLPGELIVRNTT